MLIVIGRLTNTLEILRLQAQNPDSVRQVPPAHALIVTAMDNGNSVKAAPYWINIQQSLDEGPPQPKP